jgi:hypothetical protein
MLLEAVLSRFRLNNNNNKRFPFRLADKSSLRATGHWTMLGPGRHLQLNSFPTEQENEQKSVQQTRRFYGVTSVTHAPHAKPLTPTRGVPATPTTPDVVYGDVINDSSTSRLREKTRPEKPLSPDASKDDGNNEVDPTWPRVRTTPAWHGESKGVAPLKRP